MSLHKCMNVTIEEIKSICPICHTLADEVGLLCPSCGTTMKTVKNADATYNSKSKEAVIELGVY